MKLENGINVLLPVPGLYLRPIYRKDSSGKADGAYGREWWVIPLYYTHEERVRTLHNQSIMNEKGAQFSVTYSYSP